MSSKKKPIAPANPQTLQIGSRVRCSDDGVEGRITWANGVAIKVRWDDGEQVTWRRDSLAERPIEILDPAEVQPTPVAPEPIAVQQQVSTEVPSEETPAFSPTVDTTTAEPAPLVPEPLQQQETTMPEAVETIDPTPQERPVPPAPGPKKLSALDAAAQILLETGQPMNCQELIATMAERGLWSSPGGKTPAATLYSAILREIATKGAEGRFVKTKRGQFARKA
jgi:hypothetical protein